MDLTTILNSRKSIRSFTGELIPEDALAKILSAANAAPIGLGKYESVHLTVVKSKELLSKIEENASNIFNVHDRSFLYNAPELVIVSTTSSDNVGYSNAAIVAHNMALQAVDCGVGACHIWGCIAALSQNSELIKELQIPDGFAPVCSIALGISEDAYSPREIPENRIAVNHI